MRSTVAAATRIVGAAIGLFASAALAALALGFLPDGLPGCSEGGGCNSLARGPWGVVPGTDVPWSFVGVTWFATVLAAAIQLRRSHPPAWLRAFAMAGAAAGAAFLAVMIGLGASCIWCMTVHAASALVLWGAWFGGAGASRTLDGGETHRSRSPSRGAATPLVALSAAAAAVGGLAFAQQASDRARERAAAANEAEIAAAVAESSRAAPLRGGRPLGAADAPIRVVVFTDYQCPDCARIERSIERVAARTDTSVSVRHFPLCSDCNGSVHRSLHPDACRRAALAESAARLGGTEAFRAAHRALFAIQADPGADAVAAVASATGLAREALASEAVRDEVTAALRTDIDDAIALGVTYTPMVFVNGREWKWYVVPGSLDELITRVAGDAFDEIAPPDASEKLVDDWRLGRRVAALGAPTHLGVVLQEASHPGSDVATDVPEVRVWLDARLSGTKELLQALRAVADGGTRFRLRVLQCPASSECNPASVFRESDPRACAASAAVVGADLLGGRDAARAMLDGVVEAGPEVDLGRLRGLAASIGLDAAEFDRSIESSALRDRVRAEAALLANATSVRQLPTLVIGARVVPRWSHPGADTVRVLRSIIEDAAIETRKNGLGDEVLNRPHADP